MKNIVIFLEEPLPYDHPFDDDSYLTSYTELCEEIRKNGCEVYIARGKETYEGHGKFSNSWKLENKVLAETGPIQADVIFDKGYFPTDHTVPVFNAELTNKVCTDKWYMYQLFGEFCPKTWLVSNQDEYMAALDAVTTNLIVQKPVDGQEGHGVTIGDRAKVQAAQLPFPFLVQEFLDTSAGVPGIVAGLHDFRVAIVDGEILYSYYRTPPQGSFLANVAQGGTFSMVKVSKIPPQMVEIVKKIDLVMAKAGRRFYGVDFANTATGPKIIEMNSRLGLIPNSDDPVFVTLKQKLAQILCSL